jgi:hypothetical protein
MTTIKPTTNTHLVENSVLPVKTSHCAKFLKISIVALAVLTGSLFVGACTFFLTGAIPIAIAATTMFIALSIIGLAISQNSKKAKQDILPQASEEAKNDSIPSFNEIKKPIEPASTSESDSQNQILDNLLDNINVINADFNQIQKQIHEKEEMQASLIEAGQKLLDSGAKLYFVLIDKLKMDPTNQELLERAYKTQWTLTNLLKAHLPKKTKTHIDRSFYLGYSKKTDNTLLKTSFFPQNPQSKHLLGATYLGYRNHFPVIAWDEMTGQDYVNLIQLIYPEIKIADAIRMYSDNPWEEYQSLSSFRQKNSLEKENYSFRLIIHCLDGNFNKETPVSESMDELHKPSDIELKTAGLDQLESEFKSSFDFFEKLVKSEISE